MSYAAWIDKPHLGGRILIRGKQGEQSMTRQFSNREEDGTRPLEVRVSRGRGLIGGIKGARYREKEAFPRARKLYHRTDMGLHRKKGKMLR